MILKEAGIEVVSLPASASIIASFLMLPLITYTILTLLLIAIIWIVVGKKIWNIWKKSDRYRDGNGRSWSVIGRSRSVKDLWPTDRGHNRNLDRGLTDGLTDGWPRFDRRFDRFSNQNLPKKRFLMKFLKRKNIFGKKFTKEPFFGKFSFKN